MRAEIAVQIRRLEKFSPSITSCRVVVTGPQTRHRSGDPLQIRLFIAMPEHRNVVVDRSHGGEREHALVVIREDFDAAVRQIEDAQCEMRGQIKDHVAESHGRVTKFLAGENCGFIETPDGREVYFHRNAVLNGAFDHLSVGAEVRFVEEQGAKGVQASTVRLMGKHHFA
jgi:cold shock CspA family protein